jgi:hypothetical protein
MNRLSLREIKMEFIFPHTNKQEHLLSCLICVTRPHLALKVWLFQYGTLIINMLTLFYEIYYERVVDLECLCGFKQCICIRSACEPWYGDLFRPYPPHIYLKLFPIFRFYLANRNLSCLRYRYRKINAYVPITANIFTYCKTWYHALFSDSQLNYVTNTHFPPPPYYREKRYILFLTS